VTMALNIPFMAILKAAEVLLPLTKKRSKSEEAEAKQVLVENNGSLTSTAGIIAMTAAAAAVPHVTSLEDALTPLITAIVGLLCYFYRKA